MNIPLDQLYNYLDSIVNGYVIIYRWKVHGSRNLNDCLMLREYPDPYYSSMVLPHMICHDQEPLNFEYYEDINIDQYLSIHAPDFYKTHHAVLGSLFDKSKHINLKIICRPFTGGLHDKVLLTHSELNSNEVKKYSDHGFVPVYWWANALVARDWYRYAEIDPKLKTDSLKKDFLYYARAWSGTREYRLKFAELLVNSNLDSNTRIKFGVVDSGTHYSDHQYQNLNFAVSRFDFEDHFTENQSSSDASATYDSTDYNDCWIDVVAETLFDDSRLHLTEKILRPIACGKPFILLSTCGALSHLKSYGFKTFDNFWDETYDTITDPIKRMESIINTMQTIANLPVDEKNKMYKDVKEITDYNKNLFFSNDFLNTIIDQFKNNFNDAMIEINNSKQGNNWQEFRKTCSTDAVLKHYITNDNQHCTRHDIIRVFKNLHATKKHA
jgi:hypothetical protein